jgi:hypothetical protein
MELAPPPDPPKIEKANEQAQANEELDQLIRNLPPKAVESFTQSVQPLLMNTCTTSGCHGSQSQSGLHLERFTPGEPASRRLTQRNLSVVLQYVDRDNPLASRLLTVPTYAHGTCKSAIFTEKQITQYKRLVDWVMQLGPQSTPEAPMEFNPEPTQTEAIAAAESNPLVPQVLSPEARTGRPIPAYIRRGPGANTPGGSWMDNPAAASMSANKVDKASYDEPVSKAADSSKSVKSAEALRSKIKHRATVPGYVPKDAQDPEIFNRRYFSPGTTDNDSQQPSPEDQKND